MKVIICAIARNEGKYIKDFCEYHLQLGFDEIHIFDNGTDIPIQDSRIIVHPFRNIDNKSPQMIAYNGMLFTNDIDWDWCAFIDIDEFLTMKSHTNIHDYISNIPNDIDSISMKEVVYGDSDQIIPDDITIPVYDRLTKLTKNPIGEYPKHIVRKTTGLYMLNPHIVLHKNHKITPHILEPSDECYIRHYKTKTLSEFCDQKLNTPRVNNQYQCRTISYYFKENEKTEAKLEYLKARMMRQSPSL
jgi:hypothetical protein